MATMWRDITDGICGCLLLLVGGSLVIGTLTIGVVPTLEQWGWIEFLLAAVTVAYLLWRKGDYERETGRQWKWF